MAKKAAKKKKAVTRKKLPVTTAPDPVYESIDIFLPKGIYSKFDALSEELQHDILCSIFDVRKKGDHVHRIDKVNIKEKLPLTEAIDPKKVCNGP